MQGSADCSSSRALGRACAGASFAAAVGNIVGRMAYPGSELATQAWLQQRSAYFSAVIPRRFGVQDPYPESFT